MDSERLMLSRENPRAVAFPNVQSQKSAPSMVDRFKALLRQRDDDLRVSANAAVSTPRTEEIVQLYELVLSELTFNSKPVITDLTIVAGEQREHGKGIAGAICARILEVSVEQKLPSLYLLDSIVKNIGHEYVKHFSSRLPEVFGEAYRQVQPSQRASMLHLFGTWSTVFPRSVLEKIEAQLQLSPSVDQPPSRLPPLRASESPRPAHGIHVNPKYLRQLEHSATDGHIQPGGGALAPKSFLQMATIGTIDRDDEPIKWKRNQYHNQNHLEPSAAYKLTNGRDRQGPRALIDAYGSDDRSTIQSDRPLRVDPHRVDRHDTNGLDHRPPLMMWQNSDEEEFNWEAMSPTLADHRRSENFLSSSIPSLRNVKARPDYGPSRVSSMDTDEAVPSYAFNRGSTGGISQFQNDVNRNNMVSRYPKEPWNLSQNLSQPPQHLNSRDVDSQFHGSLPVVSRVVSSTIDSMNMEGRPVILPSPGGLRPPLHLRPNLPMPNQKGQYDLINSGPNQSFYAPGQPFDRVEIPEVPLTNRPRLPNQFIAPTNHMQAPMPRGYMQGLSGPNNFSNSSLHSQGGELPPLPPGPPPNPLQAILPFPNAGQAGPTQQPGSAYSGLISSLMAQGLISLTKPSSVQEQPVGLEFNVDLLKVRHESAISALYGDMERQCTTCGLRFKSQDEHRNHMDWHVTKNRMSKTRKQKPSRKWFVSAAMWLSGAEALGTEAVPGFLPAETTVEKKSDDDVAVPADEAQNACALCGEPFEEFYSDETDEWMYRGAVYMNAAAGGAISGMGISDLGPIVHAKCRSEDFPPDEGGSVEDCNPRKRLRS